MLTFFSDRWEFPEQLGGAPGSIKDHFKQDFCRFLMFVLHVSGRSEIALGAIWAYPVPLLVSFHNQKHNPKKTKNEPSPGN